MAAAAKAPCLKGYKAIAEVIGEVWGEAPSVDAVWRYAHAEEDPLPVWFERKRVRAAAAEVRAWAARNKSRLS